MSYSRWLGEEPATATTYEYEDGRLSRAVTVRAPEFGDEDRALVLAYLDEQRETCPGCGHPMEECRDPKSAGTWQVVTETCQAARVAQAVAADHREERGLFVYTRQTGARR